MDEQDHVVKPGEGSSWGGRPGVGGGVQIGE